jgi:gas vesicle protein
MRISQLSFLFLLIFSVTIFSQHDRRNGPRDKIEALERIKLLETLDMDEETALKFFARRNEHMERMKVLMDEVDTQFNKIKNKISATKDDNDPELKKLVDSYLETHKKMDEERERFFNSLNDILTYKQLAELTLFERRFREEIRDVLFHKKRRMGDN